MIPSGKPFMLFLYEPYCIYSRIEMADIVNHISDFKNYDIYAITTYQWSSITQFSKLYHLNIYPNVNLLRDSAGQFLNYLKAPGVPYFAFYNEKKTLRRILIGKNDYSEIQSIIKE